MPDNLNGDINAKPGEFPRRRNQVDDDPLQADENKVATPADPLEVDPGKEDINTAGDDAPGLGNDYEKPHKRTTPSAEYDGVKTDGIRDGDREAFDEIPGDEEDDHPRTK